MSEAKPDTGVPVFSVDDVLGLLDAFGGERAPHWEQECKQRIGAWFLAILENRQVRTAGKIELLKEMIAAKGSGEQDAGSAA